MRRNCWKKLPLPRRCGWPMRPPSLPLSIAPIINCTSPQLISTPTCTGASRRRIAYHTLQAIFKTVPQCEVHPPLFATLPDEGAANHMRLSPAHAEKGLQCSSMAIGRGGRDLAASQAIAAQHQLPEAQTLIRQAKPGCHPRRDFP